MRHRSTKRFVATTAAFVTLIVSACTPALSTTETETALPDTQVLPTETESPAIQRETPALSPSLSPEPSATTAPSRPEEKGDDATIAVPTGAADQPLDTGRGAEEALAAATADLSQRLGVSEDDLQVRSIAPVIWPDAGLGCPEPDMMYAQVQTPGYVIMLEVEGESYRYHTDDAGRALLCTGEVPFPLIPMNPKEVDDGAPWMPVD